MPVKTMPRPGRYTPVMRARSLALSLSMLCLAGCASTKSTGPTTLATTTAQHSSGTADVDIAYEPAGPDQIRLIITLRAVGIDPMDKLVAMVEIGDFVLIEGGLSWTGFVEPRSTERHEVVLKVREPGPTASLSVRVSTSAGSEVLAREDITFNVNDGVLSPGG